MLALAGFGVDAHRSAMPVREAAQRPPMDATTVEQRRVRAAAGSCSICNCLLATGFGTISASNITPDQETDDGAASKNSTGLSSRGRSPSRFDR